MEIVDSKRKQPSIYYSRDGIGYSPYCVGVENITIKEQTHWNDCPNDVEISFELNGRNVIGYLTSQLIIRPDYSGSSNSQNCKPSTHQIRRF